MSPRRPRGSTGTQPPPLSRRFLSLQACCRSSPTPNCRVTCARSSCSLAHTRSLTALSPSPRWPSWMASPSASPLSHLRASSSTRRIEAGLTLLRAYAAWCSGTRRSASIPRIIKLASRFDLYSLSADGPCSYGWTDPWVGVVKTISILYQYGDTPMQCLFGNDDSGSLTITPTDTPRTTFVNPQRAGGTNIIAVIWGVMSGGKPVAQNVIESIISTGTVVCTNVFFGFDGEPGIGKTAQVFFQYGLTSTIQCAVGREQSTITLKPRSLAFSDPLLGRGLLHSDETSTGFRVRSPATGKYWTVFNDQIVASAADALTAAVFTYVPTTASTDPALAVWSPCGQLLGYALAKTEGSPALVVPVQSQSSRVDYELPASCGSSVLLLSLTPPSASRPTILSEAANGQILAASLGTALGNLDASKLYFEWVPVANPPTLDAAVLADLLDPCAVSTFSILAHFVWSLPKIDIGFFGTGALPVLVQKVARWWTSLTSDQRTKLSTALAAMQVVFRASGSSAPLNSGLQTFITEGFTLVKALYDQNVLWSFFKCLLTDWSWFQTGMLLANLAKYVLNVTVNSIGDFTVLATPLALWNVEATNIVNGWVKAYSPPAARHGCRHPRQRFGADGARAAYRPVRRR
ncbi:uncharacterized protein LAESUDRAFT_242089 [Laetiporus sulphureus 93-53]|uniref:Uncharacterized protein n=1 Tax=Laetiporus sulphureus 93-53 TaxID=1314785 RepID=A0A165DKT6_9APHY|nr:uncharacterized protein LAESUDRAFT_242089 [Laetiporus sulphureus 93-53]KZT05104.1 hypothetical protein LAESUDRAFT_242089 [Laetiporus sulphureus 93-53]